MNTGRNQGFTLIELMVALAVLSIVLGLIIGSFNGMLDRQRLQGAAENLYDMLLLARTESINRSSAIHVSIVAGANWCHGIDDTAACACGTANDCQIDGNNKVTASSEFTGVTLSSATSTAFVYDSRRGLPQTAGGAAIADSTFTFTAADGNSLSVRLSPVGRLKLCTDSGFRGYDSCS